MKPKIKICGLTQADNAREVALLGIDAIGLVFYEKSPRFVDVDTAVQIVKALPPFVSRVGLFVNADVGFIDEILCEVPLDTLQFHGNELPSECTQYQIPYIKALAMKNETNLAKVADDYQDATGLLLDTPSEKFGGTGKFFDWSLVQKIEKPIILAGGLNADNVGEAIIKVKPYAVDVSSGVESAKGIKDIEKVRKFLSNC